MFNKGNTIPAVWYSRRMQNMHAALYPFFIFTKHGRYSIIMGQKPVFLRRFYTTLKTSWIIRFWCARKIGIHGWNGAHCLPGQTRRGFASQPSGTEAGEERIPEWDVPGRRTRVCPLPGGELWYRQFTPGNGGKRTLTWNASLIPASRDRRIHTVDLSNHNIITETL